MPHTMAAIRTILLLALWLTASGAPLADSRIELQDGSIISGKVLSSDGKHYRIRSDTLGVIELDASQIRALSPAGEAPRGPAATHPAATSQQIESLQQQITQNQGLLDMIMALQNDPTIRQALADDELLSAIASRDLERLRQHPTIQKLLENPQLRQIIEQMQGH
ncbi:hypothetical protein [Rhabdochromatium marinum]|uniref:hypothetical protein n=1 Tax=Rhabdochromatium marinum TaxID=48729 RepID=UPI00190659D8|nr:hypothetical protein [Rhabdochromatium marinum]MBK1648397.1 hypothetical protein [Rhabdochromatium marinum]